MKLTLAAVGKIKRGPETELVERYWKRTEQAGRALGFSSFSVIELSESRASSTEQRRAEESEDLSSRCPATSALLVFDEHGKMLSSRDFATLLANLRDEARDVVLAIGGADGHGDLVRQNAYKVISLGRITLPHQLARILVAEQCYRAMTILSGHPYHRD